MARYIDANYFKKRIMLWSNDPAKVVFGKLLCDVIDEVPTADVAPKSEVDNLKVLLEMNDKAYNSLRELYHTDTEALVLARQKTEIEVAREIFEEIEYVLKIVKIPCTNEDGYITPLRASYWVIDPNDYAELKKKYTEGKEDEGK